jgi:2-oxoisovalerate dehydrogenase E1 component
VHLVTEGLQKQFGAARVFDTSLSEEGIIGRAGRWRSRADAGGRDPVPQVRRPGHRAAQQLRHDALAHANRFAAPMVVRMPGGFGKDVGDPWHS